MGVKHVPRILALTLVLIMMLPLSYIAARWQLDRHHQREVQNELLINARTEEPRPLEDLVNLKPSEFSRVVIRGVPVGATALWRKQVLNGIPGFSVLQNVTLVDGTTITVALGWTNSSNSRNIEDTVFPLTGYVRYPSSTGVSPQDVPDGQINFVSEMMADTDYSFYIQSQVAPSNLSQLQLPEISSGPHLGYVGQWILIGVASIAIYIIALRRIRKDYASEIKS